MKSNSPLGSPRRRTGLPSILVLIALAVAEGVVGAAGPETEEEGYERISDEEYAKRAASSPDQARVNQRFVPRPATEDKGDPGGLTWQPIGPRPMTGEYWSGDGGLHWTDCNAPLVVDQNQPDALLAGTHRVWRTTNSGDAWTPLSGDLTAGSGHLRAIAVADGASNTIYAGSSDGLVHVTIDAANWALHNAGLPAAPIPDIVLDPADWRTAYLCADRSTGDRVYATDDAGVAWTSLTGDLPSGLRALSLAVDFRTTSPRFYLGTDYGVYASLDEGTTWIKADANLPNLAVYDITVDAVNSLLVAGTHGRGMWRTPLDVTAPILALTSPNGGETWGIDDTDDITWTASDDTAVESVTLRLSRDGGLSYPEIIASGIADTGSYAWTVTGPASTTCRIQVSALDGAMNSTVVESSGDFVINPTTGIDHDVPLATALVSAHPNPFNPRTTISFNLGADTHARLQVFSVDGSLITTLVDRSLRAGPHEAVWNGTDAQGRSVATGSYLYTLTTADGFRASGKVLMMKSSREDGCAMEPAPGSGPGPVRCRDGAGGVAPDGRRPDRTGRPSPPPRPPRRDGADREKSACTPSRTRISYVIHESKPKEVCHG